METTNVTLTCPGDTDICNNNDILMISKSDPSKTIDKKLPKNHTTFITNKENGTFNETKIENICTETKHSIEITNNKNITDDNATSEIETIDLTKCQRKKSYDKNILQSRNTSFTTHEHRIVPKCSRYKCNPRNSTKYRRENKKYILEETRKCKSQCIVIKKQSTVKCLEYKYNNSPFTKANNDVYNEIDLSYDTISSDELLSEEELDLLIKRSKNREKKSRSIDIDLLSLSSISDTSDLILMGDTPLHTNKDPNESMDITISSLDTAILESPSFSNKDFLQLQMI